jgi:hypothetical protein
MHDSPERRYRTDRRQSPARSDDIHRRLEEKRQQIERRQSVRRQADRDGVTRENQNQSADEQSSAVPPANTPRPTE